MTSPKLDRPLVLERRNQVSDGAGGFVETWSALGTHWANVRARPGTIASTDGLAQAVNLADITVRTAVIDDPRRPQPNQRFRQGDRVWRILGVVEDTTSPNYLICQTREEATV